MDPIEDLVRASGLAWPSRPAAEAAWAAALAAWPQIQLDEAQLAAFPGPRLVGADLVTALETAPVADLAIAAACHAQEPAAHAAFDAILTEVDAAGPRPARRASSSMRSSRCCASSCSSRATASRPASPATKARARCSAPAAIRCSIR